MGKVSTDVCRGEIPFSMGLHYILVEKKLGNETKPKSTK